MRQAAVLGAGTMGNGIAHVFAQFGWGVTLIDVSQQVLDKARATIQADVEVDVIRAGRTHSTASGRLIQGGETRAHVVATFGDFSALSGPTVVREAAPSFPPPDECVPATGPIAASWTTRRSGAPD